MDTEVVMIVRAAIYKKNEASDHMGQAKNIPEHDTWIDQAGRTPFDMVYTTACRCSSFFKGILCEQSGFVQVEFGG